MTWRVCGTCRWRIVPSNCGCASRSCGVRPAVGGSRRPFPSLVEEAHATERFLSRAAELIRHGDVTRAAQFLRIPEKTLERWYYAWVERQRDTTPAAPITRIGIDELSLKKSTGSSSQ